MMLLIKWYLKGNGKPLPDAVIVRKSRWRKGILSVHVPCCEKNHEVPRVPLGAPLLPTALMMRLCCHYCCLFSLKRPWFWWEKRAAGNPHRSHSFYTRQALRVQWKDAGGDVARRQGDDSSRLAFGMPRCGVPLYHRRHVCICI